MERSQVLDASRRRRASGTTGQLKLYGMKAAYDEIIATAVKRQHEPHQIVGDLLHAEISESEPFCAIGSSTMASARSIKYQMTIAKLPLAKEIDEFDFEVTPVNETLVREPAGGARHCPRTNGGQRLALEQQRNVVLIGGTGTGKTHLAVGIARACVRNGSRGRFFNVVDLVNRLDTEARADRQGRTADILSRLDLFAIGLERMATRWLTPGRTRLSPLRPDRRPAVRHWSRTHGDTMAHST